MKIIELDFKSRKALYIQLYEEIKKLIENKDLVSGEKLPSKKQLMAEYGISQSTVQNALYILMEEGYIFSEERRGYFVSELDNLFISSRNTKTVKRKKVREKIKYNFLHSGVDKEHLPLGILKKLTKEVYDFSLDELAVAGDVQGDLELRKSICNYLFDSRGFSPNENQVIISSGTEYLFHIIFKLFDEQHYALEEPGYPIIPQILESNGIPFSWIGLDDMGMEIKKLQESSGNIACVAPSHQFPTGTIMPISRRQELLSWALEKDNRYIIEDDYDSEFKYTGQPIPALKAIDTHNKVIYIGSFSTSITPALRISYMVLPQELLEIYKKKIPYFVCPVGTLSQKVLHKFFAEGYFQKHLNRMRTIYRKKRGFLVQCIEDNSLETFGEVSKIYGSEAGLRLILSFPVKINEEKFLTLCKERSIRLCSLRSYYFTKEPERQGFLLGYASLNKEEVEDGIREIFRCASEAHEN